MALGEKEMQWQADTMKQWSLLQRENYNTPNEASYTLISGIKQGILIEFIDIRKFNFSDLKDLIPIGNKLEILVLVPTIKI